MKKIILVAITTALVLMFSGMTDQAFAQTEKGDIKLGAGLVFGSGVGFGDLDNDLGIRVDGSYMFTEDIRGAADFTFFFPKSEGGGKVTVWELNFNGHYLFVNDEDANVYGLAGLNVTGISVESDSEFGSFSSSDSEIGLNIGAGGEYDLDFAWLFGEVKFGGIGHDADQFSVAAGLRIPLGN
ncbi:MAG: outer membrane beta-barrel protein [Balneolaceae bacterium]|nr:outer membrane beta-barrel protein [Balneolaceae bacterium]